MITGFNHTSFTVSELEKAVRFWTDGLGFRADSVSERTGDWQGRITGVPGAKLKIAHLFGYNHHIELIEYLGAAGEDRTLHPNMAGVAHICLDVENIESVIQKLTLLGAAPQGEMVEVDSGPVKGCLSIYLRDPSGILIELEELPHEK